MDTACQVGVLCPFAIERLALLRHSTAYDSTFVEHQCDLAWEVGILSLTGLLAGRGPACRVYVTL